MMYKLILNFNAFTIFFDITFCLQILQIHYKFLLTKFFIYSLFAIGTTTLPEFVIYTGLLNAPLLRPPSKNNS